MSGLRLFFLEKTTKLSIAPLPAGEVTRQGADGVETTSNGSARPHLKLAFGMAWPQAQPGLDNPQVNSGMRSIRYVKEPECMI